MRIITIELINDKVLNLLKQLEQLNLLKLIPSQPESKPKNRNWAGTLSQETAGKMLQNVEESRNEWERNT